MTHPTYRNLRRNAQALRREALGNIAGAIALKWQALLKAAHAPHPSKVPTPTHP